VPLLERKRVLQAVIARLPRNSPVRYSAHHVGEGAELHQRACEMRLEGIISKRADGPYLPGRTRSWLKSKCGEEQEFVIGGFTPPQGSRSGFGALMVGYFHRRRLVYAGKVGTGFDDLDLTRLLGLLTALRTEECPFEPSPERSESRGASWVRPRLVTQVRFAEWTGGDRLRQPVFMGLREDKPPTQVRREHR
jgi:bifunctional non-homologous end joining protein LigD